MLDSLALAVALSLDGRMPPMPVFTMPKREFVRDSQLQVTQTVAIATKAPVKVARPEWGE